MSLDPRYVSTAASDSCDSYREIKFNSTDVRAAFANGIAARIGCQACCCRLGEIGAILTRHSTAGQSN